MAFYFTFFHKFNSFKKETIIYGNFIVLHNSQLFTGFFNQKIKHYQYELRIYLINHQHFNLKLI